MIPFAKGAHAGRADSFVPMDFPDPADPELIYVDTPAGDLFLEPEAKVGRDKSVFELRGRRRCPRAQVRRGHRVTDQGSRRPVTPQGRPPYPRCRRIRRAYRRRCGTGPSGQPLSSRSSQP
ncbi:Scr1 family TA system antitoxin-like transcriptional regulator [Streptomyces sp. NPDC096310]|uniref:Scr1 family TA system antitoxin-like transcriptional regulator n=1 Tax=Streptomyces sp. NPDC096310 TaxID=3366082 RepID=UPI00380B408B